MYLCPHVLLAPTASVVQGTVRTLPIRAAGTPQAVQLLGLQLRTTALVSTPLSPNPIPGVSLSSDCTWLFKLLPRRRPSFSILLIVQQVFARLNPVSYCY